MKTKKRLIIIIFLALVLIGTGSVFYFKKYIIYKVAQKMFLKEGQPIVFGEYTVFIDKIEDNELTGIKITNNKLKLEAKKGRYIYLENDNAVKIELNDGMVEGVSQDQEIPSARMTFKQYSIKLSLNKLSLK